MMTNRIKYKYHIKITSNAVFLISAAIALLGLCQVASANNVTSISLARIFSGAAAHATLNIVSVEETLAVLGIEVGKGCTQKSDAPKKIDCVYVDDFGAEGKLEAIFTKGAYFHDGLGVTIYIYPNKGTRKLSSLDLKYFENGWDKWMPEPAEGDERRVIKRSFGTPRTKSFSTAVIEMEDIETEIYIKQLSIGIRDNRKY